MSAGSRSARSRAWGVTGAALKPAGAAAFAMLLALPAGPVKAQLVEGVVVEDGSEDPVSRAVVRLERTDDEVVRSTATDSEGRFAVMAPGAGEYRLVVEHLSYVTVETEAFQLEEGTSHQVTVRVDADAVLLDALVVEGRGRASLQEPTYEGFYARHARSPSVGFNRAIGPDDPFWDESMTVRQFLRFVGPPARCSVEGAHFFYEGRQVSPMGSRPNPAWVEALLNMTLAELEGVEIYTTQTSAPLDFRAVGPELCLGIAVWPRRVWEPEARVRRAALAADNPFGPVARPAPETLEEPSTLRSLTGITGLASLLTGLYVLALAGR